MPAPRSPRSPARFGVAERTVEQRLRLGNAAPELLQAYREDAMDLECLKAFAITTDRVRQMTVWQQVSEQGYRPTAWQIKRMLTESRVPAGAAVAAFVGVEAYEAAGGAVDRDLFADEHEFGVWFEDPQLLDKLALERLRSVAEDLASEWKWAEPRLEIEWSDTARFGRVQPVPGEATPEEIAESERLQARQEELSNMDPDELTEELYAESQRNEERLDDIESEVQSRASFSDEDKAIAGCIVTIDHDGDLHVVGGLVRPEDVPSADAGGNTGDDAGENGTAARRAIPAPPPDRGPRRPVEPPRMSPPRNGDPAAQARKAAGIGIGLADDIRAIRTAGIKARLATDFDAAFDLFLFQEAQSVFDQGYRPTCLEITARETADRPHLRINDDSFAEASPFEADLADRSGIPLDWMEHEDRGKAFEALRALPVERKQALFAAIVARTVKGQLSFEHDAHPELEATVARLDIDFASRVRVSAEMFWSRITKSKLLEIGRSVLGADWAAAHSKEKKAVLAAAMERAFGAGDDLPPSVTPEGRAAALAWVPPGFAAFDRAGIEDDEAEPDEPAPPSPRRRNPPADRDRHRARPRAASGGAGGYRPRRVPPGYARRPRPRDRGPGGGGFAAALHRRRGRSRGRQRRAGAPPGRPGRLRAGERPRRRLRGDGDPRVPAPHLIRGPVAGPAPHRRGAPSLEPCREARHDTEDDSARLDPRPRRRLRDRPGHQVLHRHPRRHLRRADRQRAPQRSDPDPRRHRAVAARRHLRPRHRRRLRHRRSLRPARLRPQRLGPRHRRPRGPGRNRHLRAQPVRLPHLFPAPLRFRSTPPRAGAPRSRPRRSSARPTPRSSPTRAPRARTEPRSASPPRVPPSPWQPPCAGPHCTAPSRSCSIATPLSTRRSSTARSTPRNGTASCSASSRITRPLFRQPDVNFHGLTIEAKLPTVQTIDDGVWAVRADIDNAPDLELVLPARKELVETRFAADMREAARLAIYRAMRQGRPLPGALPRGVRPGARGGHRHANPPRRAPPVAPRDRPTPTTGGKAPGPSRSVPAPL